MKRIPVLALAAACGLACAGLAWAQPSSDIALTRAALQTERQALVTANLGLTEEEGLAFWPVYRDYRVEMAHVGDRMVKLISDYAKNRETLTDPQATTMLSEYLDIQSDELAVKKKFVKTFEKVLPPKKVARFYQIENKLDAVVRAEIADVVPLVH